MPGVFPTTVGVSIHNVTSSRSVFERDGEAERPSDAGSIAATVTLLAFARSTASAFGYTNSATEPSENTNPRNAFLPFAQRHLDRSARRSAADPRPARQRQKGCCFLAFAIRNPDDHPIAQMVHNRDGIAASLQRLPGNLGLLSYLELSNRARSCEGRCLRSACRGKGNGREHQRPAQQSFLHRHLELLGPRALISILVRYGIWTGFAASKV